MVPDGCLHHVGYVVKSIEECVVALRAFTKHDLGQEDPYGSASVGDRDVPVAGNGGKSGKRAEPQGETAPTTRFFAAWRSPPRLLRRGDFEAAVRAYADPDVRVIRAPAPATAFGQRHFVGIYPVWFVGRVSRFGAEGFTSRLPLSNGSI